MLRKPFFAVNPTRLKPENCARATADFLRARLAFSTEKTEALDFGCGAGALAFLLARLARRVTAIDSTPELIAEIQTKITYSRQKNLRAIAMDLTVAPRLLFGAHFDLIVGSLIFHHLENHVALLTELKTLLKPRGIIAVIDLQSEDGSFHPQNISVPHCGFAPMDFAATLAEAGFFNITTEIFYSLKYERRGQWREYPIFAALADNAPVSTHLSKNDDEEICFIAD